MRTRLVLFLMIVALVAAVVPASAHHRDGHDRGGRPPHAGPPGDGGDDASGELPPADYIAMADQLSPANYVETVREALHVPMPDGEELYVEIVRPDPAFYGEGPWPVIMEASPYHGTIADRDGTRIFPDPTDDFGRKIGLTGYFAPRGYAVAIVDLRGTGRSSGCLDHLGQDDGRDLKTIIEWLADQPWSTGKVGMTGHSYVGSTPSVAAAQRPRGLATIVPSAGLASMYDHQFNKGVPWLLQWAGPQWAYELLALARHMPPGTAIPLFGYPGGDDFGNHVDDTGCGLPNSALTSGSGQVTGQYELWHAERDHRQGAIDADIPVFMIHGVNDNAARIPAAEWFFDGRYLRDGDKVWIGQWDHGSTNGRCGDEDGNRTLHPTCRFDQFKYALHAWFDKHVRGMDVDTGPAVEAYLNGPTPIDVTRVVDPETIDNAVVTGDAWRRPDRWLTLHPDATDMSLRLEPPTETGQASFGTTAEGLLVQVQGGELTFTSDPLAEDTVLLGLPHLQLNASVSTGEIIHLVTRLYREQDVTDEDGEVVEVLREPINHCAIQPQLRHGVETVAPVVPLQEMALPLQCFTMAHWVPAGQRLVLEVSTRSPHHATYGSDRHITVYTGPGRTHQRLPELVDPVLHDDVPLREDEQGDDFPVGPAQPPVEGNVIVPVSGFGNRIEPVTAASVEFDIEEGYDNARLEALAVPRLPADIDLFLQQRIDDAWVTVASGTSGSTSQELLTAGRQPAGHYRIVVHNWGGAPTDVDLTVTFFNQEDEPGSGDATTATAVDTVTGPRGALLPLP